MEPLQMETLRVSYYANGKFYKKGTKICVKNYAPDCIEAILNQKLIYIPYTFFENIQY